MLIIRKGVGIASAGPLLLLDGVPNVTAAFSFRKLRTAYAGPSIRIRRPSDNAEQDIGFSGNNFDATTFSSFVGGGTGFIKIKYDQGLNGNDVAQTTTTAQPAVNLNSLNGQPTASFVAANSQCLTSAVRPITNPPQTALTMLYVGRTTADFAGLMDICASGGVNTMYDLRRGSAIFSAHDGLSNTDVTIAADNNFHQFSVFFATNFANLAVDGTAGTPATTTTTFVTTGNALDIGCLGIGGTFFMSGDVAEAVFIDHDYSGGADATLRANQKAYWGTP